MSEASASRGLKIGSLTLDGPFVLAPLAGATNLPFRLLARQYGAALVWTEMVSAAGLYQGGRKTVKLTASTPAEKPLAVQIFGSRPEWMAAAAEVVQEAGADVVDLNMGCPVRKVVRSGSGAALLQDPPLAGRIVRAVRARTHVPLTVKTRLGWARGIGEPAELFPRLFDLGVDAVSVHGRYAVQMFSGRADWDAVSRAAQCFAGPVIGNGDVTDPGRAVRCLRESGVDGVMIGRGAMGAPWIFRQAADLWADRPVREVDLDERLRCALAHARLLAGHLGPGRAAFMLRGVLMWYTKGLPGSSSFRGAVNRVSDCERLIGLLIDYFQSLGAQPAEEAAAV